MKIGYRFQSVLNPKSLFTLNGVGHSTLNVLHTSGSFRFWRCFLGEDVSVVTTQRSSAASAYATRNGSRPITSSSVSVRSGVAAVNHRSDYGGINFLLE